MPNPKQKIPLAPKVNLYKKIAITFLVVTFILVVGFGYFSLNKAVIVIRPEREAVKTSFYVQVKDLAKLDAAQEPEVVAGSLAKVTLEQSKTFVATGSKALTSEVTGKVILINDQSTDQTLIVKTRLLTPDNLLFRLKARVVVPANGTLEAEVYADDNSAIKEVVAPTTFTVPGLTPALQKVVYAKSEAPIYPAGQEAKIVTEEDLAKAEKVLVEDLLAKAGPEFGLVINDLGQKSPLYQGKLSYEIVEKKLVNIKHSLSAGGLGEEFTSEIQEEIKGLIFDKARVEELAQGKLQSVLPAGKDLVGFIPENIVYLVESYDEANNSALLKVEIEAESVINADHELLAKDKLMGLGKEDLKFYLSRVPGVNQAEIRFYPFWAKQVPKIKERISVEVVK